MGLASETQLLLLLQAVEELIAERQASPQPLVRHEAEILSIFRSQLLAQMGDDVAATG